MSERVFRFLLSELTVVRLRCKNDGCGAVVELRVADLAARALHDCPLCRRRLLLPPGDRQPDYGLHDLARVMTALAAEANPVAVEFVIPAPGE